MIIRSKKGGFTWVKDYDKTFPMPCVLCQMRVGNQEHHFLSKSKRKFAEEDGLKGMVCEMCHDEIHNKKGAKLKRKCQRIAQRIYELFLGTHEDFTKRYGENYL